ncbi:peroxiredoxin [bacterium]|nr:peroxiredoxin [bacterium]
MVGNSLPSVRLAATTGEDIDISKLLGITVVYAYPRTSPPNEPPIEGWDKIQGARGCTPQSKGYAARYTDLKQAGVGAIFGLSTQDTAYQAEAVDRMELPFPILSDEKLELATAIGLPTFEAGGMTLLTRLSLIIQDGKLRKIFSPIDNPAENAADMLRYLKTKSLDFDHM